MRLWYLSHRRPAKAQASLRPHNLARAFSVRTHGAWKKAKGPTKKIRYLVPLDGCACAFEECIYEGRFVCLC